jgi:UDP-GlcNAc:undecaprenyl-phosphate GlcNAc-1-phosphate transferase
MSNFEISILVIFLTFFLILILQPISKLFGLIDLPNKRKVHKVNAKLIGGLVLVTNFLFLAFLLDLNKSLNTLLVYSVFVFLIGLWDDKYTLKASIKLILLLVPITLMIYGGFVLADLGKYSGIGVVNLGSFSIFFTILAVLLLINATNYIDGKDGVLITIFFLINSKLLYLTYNSEDISKYILIYINLILLILLLFNLTNIKSLKIFLGDSGSLTIGFFISFILIYFAKNDLAHPILLASTITVLVFDFLCVSIERLMRNINDIFIPDNDHIHHLIYNKTKSNVKTLIIINLINFLFFIINYNIFKIYDLLTLIFFIIEFFIFFILRRFLIR